MNRDFKSRIAITKSLAPIAKTASANTTGVDVSVGDGAVVEITVGVITDGTHTPVLQESDDDSTYTAVAAADQVGTLAALTSGVYQYVGYIGIKKYLRIAFTVSGTTTGGIYGVSVIVTNKRKQP